MTELVKQVVNKEVDVAFIASCLLENMEADGVIPKGCLKVVNEKKDENFYCKHSTRLYPGWILSAQPTLESKTLRKIMEALLQLPPGKEEGSYWTVATDYDQMNLLLERMEVRLSLIHILRIGIICDVGNRKIIRKECPNQHDESEGQTCEGNA